MSDHRKPRKKILVGLLRGFDVLGDQVSSLVLMILCAVLGFTAMWWAVVFVHWAVSELH